MKTPISLTFVLLVISITCFHSCSEAQQPIEKSYVGTWSQPHVQLKIRTRTGLLQYAFTEVDVPFNITISESGKASGNIGDVSFLDIPMKRNSGDVHQKGVIYLVQLNNTGKLTPADPESGKNIGLWIQPLQQDGKLYVECRQLLTLDPFPMGQVVCERK